MNNKVNRLQYYILLRIAIVSILIIPILFFPFDGKDGKQDIQLELKRNIDDIEIIYVNHSNNTIFTGYSLSVDETDESPCIGAHNNNLCILNPDLKNNNITICASRDLPLDTLIYIDGIGECIVKDRMNKRYKGTNRIDILFDNKQEAINFGKNKLNYVIINE